MKKYPKFEEREMKRQICGTLILLMVLLFATPSLIKADSGLQDVVRPLYENEFANAWARANSDSNVRLLRDFVISQRFRPLPPVSTPSASSRGSSAILWQSANGDILTVIIPFSNGQRGSAQIFYFLMSSSVSKAKAVIQFFNGTMYQGTDYAVKDGIVISLGSWESESFQGSGIDFTIKTDSYQTTWIATAVNANGLAIAQDRADITVTGYTFSTSVRGVYFAVLGAFDQVAFIWQIGKEGYGLSGYQDEQATSFAYGEGWTNGCFGSTLCIWYAKGYSYWKSQPYPLRYYYYSVYGMSTANTWGALKVLLILLPGGMQPAYTGIFFTPQFNFPG